MYTRNITYMRAKDTSACALGGGRGVQDRLRSVNACKRAARVREGREVDDALCSGAQPRPSPILTAHASPCEGVAAHNAFCDEAGERRSMSGQRKRRMNGAGRKTGEEKEQRAVL